MSRVFFIFIAVWLIINHSYAVDIVKANIGESTLDKRIDFKNKILKTALDLTKEEFGDYRIEVHNYYMNAKRGFMELAVGKTINVYFSITQNKWEEQAVAIRIPVRRGLVSYRLLIIDKKNKKEFSTIDTLDELKAKRAGLNDGWTTYSIMEDQNFNIVDVDDYDGMFNMLSVNRFDYLLRGVNEVFEEVDQRSEYNSDLMIEPNLAVYIPSITYVFVSKREPRIARRLQRGLELMSINGDLERIFNTFYADALRKAELDKRKILYIKNPDLPANVPLDVDHFWFDAGLLKNNNKLEL